MQASLPPRGLPLLTGEQAGDADRAAVAAGDTWDGLLARAGGGLARVVVEVLQARTGGVYGRRALIAVGKGDNGGDGWVCAARLRDRGVAVTVLAPHGADVDTSDHTVAARARWLDSGGRVVVDAAGYHDQWPRWQRHVLPDVAVDCLLGTGASGAPRSPADIAVRVLRGLRQGGVPVVACDVPSGVDADTGEVADQNLVVRADATATFGAAKRGLVLAPGRWHAGDLRVIDLGARWELPTPFGAGDEAGAWFATGDWWAAPRPWDPDADKRDRGRVLVVAGSQRYGGAAALCGRAALRTGAGLVTVATSGPTAAVLADEPALMVRALPAADDDVGGPASASARAVEEALTGVGVAVLGPGLGHGQETRVVVEAVLANRSGGVPRLPNGQLRRVVVLDADACNVFRDDLDGLVAATDPGVTVVLTPHERELARLLGREAPTTAAARAGMAQEVAARTGGVVVAKGPSTVVVGADEPTLVATSGGPALGTGGTGDVLAGMVGATLARGHSVPDRRVAQRVAGVVHLHGLAGEHAGARAAGRATASDVVDALPAVLAGLAERRADEDRHWSGT